ncbi:MAG: porin family protein [Sinobacteraceae bacterium]|nr:porin family protein [Nevskiaceae bacterium]MCP5360197.1 porin family protein [Nevskiaceae bacterium]MCP5473160.1 porin family protein [Nevskiaceae bacterium]
MNPRPRPLALAPRRLHRLALPGFLLIAAGLLLAAGSARAADNGFYLGAGLTQSKIDDVGPSIDFKDNSFKLIAGFRPLDAFAIEFNYIDLGRDGANLGPISVDVDGKAYAAFAVGLLPLPLVDLYAKAGVARWESKARTTGISLDNLDDSGTEFAYGAGVQARLGSLAARLEYERFDIADTDGAELISLGVTWTFL